MLTALSSELRLGPLLGLRIPRKCRPAIRKQETLKRFSLTALGYLGQGAYKKNPCRIPWDTKPSHVEVAAGQTMGVLQTDRFEILSSQPHAPRTARGVFPYPDPRGWAIMFKRKRLDKPDSHACECIRQQGCSEHIHSPLRRLKAGLSADNGGNSLN